MSTSSADTVEFVAPAPSAGSGLFGLQPTPARVDLGGLSHPGKVRSNNEDHFYVARFGRFLETLLTNLPEGEVPPRFEDAGYGIVVADGVGGSVAGEVASRLAIRTLLDLIVGTPDWILLRDDDALREEVKRRTKERYGQIGTALAEEAQADPTLWGFGTTLTLAASVGKDLLVAHLGDSRAYLHRAGTLHALTRDHTLAQSLADQGVLAQKDVATNRWRHVLTKSLSGKGGPVEPDIREAVLEDGDCLLVCTDGLTEMVPDARIAEVLRRGEPAEQACQDLVEEALNAGGKDNVTVVVARYSFPGS